MFMCGLFAPINRASTIPKNISDHQCLTWSVGQENISGTYAKLQREHENKIKTKRPKERKEKQKNKYRKCYQVGRTQRRAKNPEKKRMHGAYMHG